MKLRPAVVSAPEPDELGPAMLALDEKRRRFVVAYIGDSRDATRCARAAGYDGTHGALRVQSHRLMHSLKVIAAIKEEADRRLNSAAYIAVSGDRRLNSAAYIAVSGLADIAADCDHRDRQKACDSILDRTGFPRREIRTVTPDDDDYGHRTTGELLDMVRGYAIQNYPDLCKADVGGTTRVDLDKTMQRLKARVAAEIVSRREQPALANAGAEDASE